MRNTLYAGRNGGELQFVNRTYLSDQGSDGAGWGPADTPFGGHGLPTYTGTLANGTKLSACGGRQAICPAHRRRHQAAHHR